MIDAIVYINLDNRTDRKNSVQAEIASMGFDSQIVHRISAVPNKECGHLGCGQSHVLALELALKNNWTHVMILEDDFHFDVSAEELQSILNEAQSIPWDVFLLAKGHIAVNEPEGKFQKVKYCTTASGYIVKRQYLDTLHANFVESVTSMKLQLENWKKFHDPHWKTIGKDSETCTLPIGSRIRYCNEAHIGEERILSTNTFCCSREFFGYDPHPGQKKYVQCFSEEPVGKMPKLIYYVDAVDQHWMRLQAKDNFYITSPTIGHQGGFTSDTF